MDVDDQVDRLVAALNSVPAGAAARITDIDTHEWRRLEEGRWQRSADAAALDLAALHESSHAVTATKFGRPVNCVLLRGDATGEVRFDPSQSPWIRSRRPLSPLPAQSLSCTRVAIAAIERSRAVTMF